MVDVGNKAETRRAAKAVGVVHLGKAACQAVKQNLVKKGDVLATARLAGIMAAKQTSTLIPLCHSLALDRCGSTPLLLSSLRGLEIFQLSLCRWSMLLHQQCHISGTCRYICERLLM